MKPFWKWLMLFAYRRWASAMPRKPVGIPYNRDPDCPCDCYEPRPKKLGDFGDWGKCNSDGHYLCSGCAHFKDADREEMDLIELNI